VGMWQALTAKNPIRAFTGNFARIMVLPNIAYLLLYLVAALFSRNEPGWKFFLGSWVGLGLAADLFFGLRSRHKLLTKFRSVATERYTQRRRWRGRWTDESVSGVPSPPVVAVSK